MKTDPTLEDQIPDSISPEDALTLALTNKRFAKHVVKRAIEEMDPDLAGERMHSEARRRHNAKMIRLNQIKPSEINPAGAGRPKREPFAPPGARPTKIVNGRTSIKPLWNGDQLRQKLKSYDRSPFLDVLALFMECIPTPQTIMAFADKYPDRWTKALLELGRLGGFADKQQLDVNFEMQVRSLSDSQLEDRLRDEAYRLGIPLPALLTMISAQNSRDITPAAVSDRRSAEDITPEDPEVEKEGEDDTR